MQTVCQDNKQLMWKNLCNRTDNLKDIVKLGKSLFCNP